MVSHELGTPLSVILAATEALDGYGDRMTERQRHERLAGIRSQVQRMTQLLEDLASLGRERAGRLCCQRQSVDVEALCREVVAALDPTAVPRHGIVVAARCADRDAHVDPRLLRQIVCNLLTNAVKYSPPASTVRLELANHDGVLRLWVRDRGIGIDPVDRSSLFEPFRRGGNVGDRPGTGLGLTIAKQAVELHGGTIDVESVLGVGTTFAVMLPAGTGETG